MRQANSLKSACGTLFLCLATVTALHAQVFTTLFNFDGTHGNHPGYGSLVQGADGNFYGTTVYGGTSANCTYNASGCGTVFKVTPAGALTTLHSFCTAANCTDGYYPFAGLILGTDGNLYGTTEYGGTGVYCGTLGCGTVFSITSAGTLTTLYSFGTTQAAQTDGCCLLGALVQARNGNFYGTTGAGGSNGGGTIFKLTPGGKLTTLYSFCDACGQGHPYYPTAGLVQAGNGNFYGITSTGGDTSGTVFEFTSGGILTMLHEFLDTGDGYEPKGELILGRNGSLYGTTAGGPGTVFEITPTGKLTTLYTFCVQNGCPDGASPIGSLIQATDGNFYGTASVGGSSTNCNGFVPKGCGTIFKMTPSGTVTTLHSFDGTDGDTPLSGVTQSTGGNLFGTANSNAAVGTVFRLSAGLGPFVETLPGSGKVGVKVIILGTNLTGASSVTFNGTEAAFTVVSASKITTTVPIGATNGPVQVTTPRRTLNTNFAFRVTP